jgi:hypothetical protein
MFYEDVMVKGGETIPRLAVAYGYLAKEWKLIWDDPKNSALVASRGKPENVKAGDVVYIPIPWKVIRKTLQEEPSGVKMVVRRNGRRGLRLRWAQTVNRHNQPFGVPNVFCTDPCGPPDDNAPFYYTTQEIKNVPERRKRFEDHPSRPIPSPAIGTTKWRAVLSVTVITNRRVTIFNSFVWGFNLDTSGKVSKFNPRPATKEEIDGHLNLLGKGKGNAGKTFLSQGWTFRTAP